MLVNTGPEMFQSL